MLVEVDKEEKKIKYVPSCSSQLLESSLKQLNVTGYNEKLWNPLFKPPEAAFTSDKAPEAEIEMDRRDSGAGSNSPAGARSSFSGQANSDRQRDGGSGTKRYREYEDTRPGRQRGRGGHYWSLPPLLSLPVFPLAWLFLTVNRVWGHSKSP